MYYTRKLASLWIAYGEVKVLKKVKNPKIVRKEKRNPVRGYELGNPFSSPPEKENRSNPRIKQTLTPDKADPSQDITN